MKTHSLWLLALALPCPALAEAAPERPAPVLAATEEVIVVGRSDQPITLVPRGLAVALGRADFAGVNAANVEDLMKYAPNFFVRKRYIGDPNGIIGFRGTNSTQSARSLVLVDGFVISNLLGNSYSFPPKWGVVAPSDIRQFDFIYGPYSARYPGSAMGGVVAMTTSRPRADEAFASVQGFVQPYKQYRTDETLKGGAVEAGLSYAPEESRFAARFSYRRLDNVGQPMSFAQLSPVAGGGGTPVSGAVYDGKLVTPGFLAGAQSPDHTVQDQLRLRADLDLGGGWALQGLAALWMTDSDKTDPESYLRDAAGSTVLGGRVNLGGQAYTVGSGLTFQLGERREVLTGLKAVGPAAGGEASLALTRFWIDRQQDRASSDYASGLARGAGTLTEAGAIGWWTADAGLEWKLGAHSLAVGASGAWYETGQTNYAVAHWQAGTARSFSTGTSGQTALYGLYVEDEIALGDAVALTLGLRGEHWRAFDGRIGRPVGGVAVFQRYREREDRGLDPKISLQAPLGAGVQAQLSLATATRYPTVGELFQGRLDSSGQFDPGSFDPNLKPERSRDANLILRWQPGEDLRLTGSLFYQQVEDAIFSVQGFNQFGAITNSFKNIDEVRQYGAELILEAEDLGLEGLDLDANLAWIDARTVKNRALPSSEDERFPRIPEWRVNAALRYELTDTLKVNFGARYASRPNTDLEGKQRGDTFGYTSEFFILDAKLSWDVTDKARLSFGVDNLNNDRAWVFHPYPQRTYMVELGYRFGEGAR